MSARLNTDPNMISPDEFYAALVEMHRGLDEGQSMHVNARLILLLSNHIGDLELLKEAMWRARAGME